VANRLDERKASKKNDIDQPKRNGHIANYEPRSRQASALQLRFLLDLRERKMSTDHSRNAENKAAASQSEQTQHKRPDRERLSFYNRR